MELEFVDRRGANKVVEEVVPAAVAEKPKQVLGERLEWKNVAYAVVIATVDRQPMIFGRALGLRTDGITFVADYLIPPWHEEGFTWTGEARKRLDTFRGCSCDKYEACKFHGEQIPMNGRPGKWMQADLDRLKKLQNTPVPEAMEVFIRAQMETPALVRPR